VPALPAASKVIRTACSGFFTGGGLWLTRFYTSYSGAAPTNAMLLTFDAAIAATWATNVQPLQDNQTELTQIESVDLSSATSAVDITSAAVIGTRGASELPGQVCMVISYEIARRYRGGHPRGYWPMGVQGDLQNTRLWTAAFTAEVLEAMQDFQADVFAAGWAGAGTLAQVNVSYYSGFHVVTNPITGRARNVPLVRVTPVQDPVTALTPRAYIGTQRRREAFVG
jgi:hypothetical protein